MLRFSVRHSLAVMGLLTLLAGCGGGGAPSDVDPNAPRATSPVSGPDSFLLFPNPQRQDDGVLQIAAQGYANAYYAAIDPSNERDTLAKFKAKNQFGTGTGSLGEESIIVGDQRDLGYGRKLTARQNVDGSLAFVVENYLVGAYGAYSSLNLDAAVVSEAKWHLGTNAIEFSPGPGGTINFVKFYTYDPLTGQRLTMANLDGRGAKAMPTVCASCHGGRGDPLTPTGLFPRLMNAKSAVDTALPSQGGVRGDMGAQLHPLEPASFDYSSTPGFARASLEAKMKTINKMVLCSLPIPVAAGGEDACRRTAINDEYQGTAAEHLKDMYGGAGMPNATAATTDTYVPAGWAAQSALYLNTQAQACRVCHLLRGTGNQSDIDFATFTKFDGYSERIKAHVLDRGNMPLARLIADKFWATPSIYTPMATYLTGKGYTNTSTAPGAPIANPGPDRVIKATSATLSASMSLYSDSYQWSISPSSPTAGATLTNATSASPTFTAPGNGTYWVLLTTSKSGVTSAQAKLVVVVDTALGFDPAALRFNDIKTILQGAGTCTGCHTAGGGPPIWYTNFDRNGDGATDATDDHWFYTELRGRINFSDIAASKLLMKPTGHHHGGGTVLNIGGLPPGDATADRVMYDKILSWILNGAPE
jgi:cytochrome c553